jgi:hypothetical protein
MGSLPQKISDLKGLTEAGWREFMEREGRVKEPVVVF